MRLGPPISQPRGLDDYSGLMIEVTPRLKGSQLRRKVRRNGHDALVEGENGEDVEDPAESIPDVVGRVVYHKQKGYHQWKDGSYHNVDHPSHDGGSCFLVEERRNHIHKDRIRAHKYHKQDPSIRNLPKC